MGGGVTQAFILSKSAVTRKAFRSKQRSSTFCNVNVNVLPSKGYCAFGLEVEIKCHKGCINFALNEAVLIYQNNNDISAVCLIVRYAHTRLHKGGIEIAEINLRAW